MFDSHLMVLTHADTHVHLTANESELLLMLLQGVATKAAVMKRVWESKGVVVTDSSYHQLVRAVRQRLEEHGVSGALVKTLPRQGLRFLGSLKPLDTAIPPVPQPHAPSGLPTPLANDNGCSDSAAKHPYPSSQPASPGVSEETTNTQPAPDLPTRFGPLARTSRWFGKRGRWFAAIALPCATVLTWQTLASPSGLTFRHGETIDGITYHSTSGVSAKALIDALEIKLKPGDQVYELPLGDNRWLAVCPESIHDAPELCETYFARGASSMH
jgi:DNA-binding winged helix-turn-helix (wHTH) protein